MSLRIDLHTHVLPERWPDLKQRYGYGGFVQLRHHRPGWARMEINGKCFREIESNCWSNERRLAECDRDRVDVQVLSTVPVMFSYWARPGDALDLARILNDDLAERIQRHPKRFVGLGTLPLQDPQLSIQELERCVSELGLSGVQIGSHVNEWNLDQPELFPIFERAADLGTAVFVHPWDMLGAERMGRYWMRWLVGMPVETTVAICSVIFGGVLQRLPGLRIAFAHGGGSFPGTLGRIEHGYRVRPDLFPDDRTTEPREQFERIYLDSLVHDAQALRFLIQSVSAQRIALGSDYPFPLGETRPGELIDSLEDLTEQQRSRLLAGTALEFLGLQAARFV
jgi:aminocarboxymuconate-semialdehyde decarboxylase